MLNPSTADEIQNDPTVERCERRARAMGFEGIEVRNIFALRSTDPTALYSHADPVGRDNDNAILDGTRRASLVICGWGNHGSLANRGGYVLQLLRRCGIEAHALRLTAAGHPGHPLYVPYSAKPFPITRIKKQVAKADVKATG